MLKQKVCKLDLFYVLYVRCEVGIQATTSKLNADVRELILAHHPLTVPNHECRRSCGFVRSEPNNHSICL